MKPDTGRIAAFNVLKRVLLSGGYSNISLDEEIKRNLLSSDEKKLAAKISYGVLERKVTLQIILNKFITRSPKPEIKVILFMGIYQILYLDNIPPHAAVNSSVDLAKMISKNKAQAGFVNAILHKILREGKEKILEYAYKTDEGRYSISSDMLSIIRSSLKERTAVFLESSFDKPPIYLRVNTLKTTAEALIALLAEENVSSEKIDGFNEALRITGNIDITKTECYKNGLFFVQDLSSQMAIKALEIESDSRVFDLCAAPGGKSFCAAMYLKEGNITSFDIHEHKIKLIKDASERLNIENLKVEKKDALDLSDREDMADIVICDVPCSGSGVIRRKPEIRYKNDDYKDLYNLQTKILNSAARMVKIGGKLLYSTCSVNKLENEEVVKKFLSLNDGFEVLKQDKSCGKIKGNCEFGTTILPEDFGGDGFFFSVIERRG